MAHLFDIPERAIQCFERWSNLQVTIHRYQADLTPYLSPERFMHRHIACRIMKLSGHETRCATFDQRIVRRKIEEYIPGRAHMCHAGLIEWVVPVFNNYDLLCILFAGVRRPGSSFHTYRTEQDVPRTPSLWQSETIPPVEAEEADLILEGLHQLGARLRQWYVELRSMTPNRSYLRDRRTTIMAYIQSRYTTNAGIEGLSKILHLSVSRTAHIVKKECGKSFTALVHEARVRSAAAMLRETSLPISDVARASGFGDLKHFYTIFKRETGRTPGEYRREAQIS